MNQPDGFIDPHGGFRNLKSYQMSEIVYDATVVFCDRWNYIERDRARKDDIARKDTLC